MTRWFAVVLMILSFAAHARVEVHEFDSPQQEALYKKLIAELRCLVCQNQNLADSNAELAVDLRRKTYQMVKENQSEQQIADYMVDRYGEFVLYRPPLNRNTMLLWSGPFLILLAGLVMLIRTIRRRRADTTAGIDDKALEDASTLLNAEPEKRDV